MNGGASPKPTPQRLAIIRSTAYRAARDRGCEHRDAEGFADFCVAAANSGDMWLTLRDAWMLWKGETER